MTFDLWSGLRRDRGKRGRLIDEAPPLCTSVCDPRSGDQFQRFEDNVPCMAGDGMTVCIGVEFYDATRNVRILLRGSEGESMNRCMLEGRTDDEDDCGVTPMVALFLK
jgi:hypothetical protein